MSATTVGRRRIRESRFWQAYYRSRYAILFYALLLTLLIMPVAATLGLPRNVIRFLLATCLLCAVMPSATKHSRVTVFTGTMLLVVARFAADGGTLPFNPGFVLALVGVTGLVAAATALQFAVTTKTVDRETIYAALDTYLLAGLFFGQIFWSLERLWPGSLVGPDPTTEVTSVYYSFITLATLGYGDFVPRTDVARGLAMFEVIGGQLFLAVMVARLIGLFAPNEQLR